MNQVSGREGEVLEEQYAAFFSRHYGSLRAFVRRRVAPDDVDEVAAEVFVQAWQRWPESGERGLPWLYRAARLVIQNHQRALARHDSVQQEAVTIFRATLHPGAEDAAVEVVERDAAADVLARLGEQDRDVLLLSCWEGLSAADIGKVLGCSTPAAYVRLHRARRRLDVLMDESGEVGRQSTEPPGPAPATTRGERNT